MPLLEKALIQRIRARAKAGSAVVAGIGDDCAVLRVPPGHELLVTTDLMVERVHFRRDWEPPESIGRRCLTRGLSDVAAMGGEPRACFVSLALSSGVPQKWVDKFFRGLLRWAERFRAPLAGGDIAQTPSGIHADIVVVGSVPRGKAILRSGAKPGDLIYVTGRLGASAAIIAAKMTAEMAGSKSVKSQAQSRIHPVPRLAVGAWLRTRGAASAMIDTSDGLSTDLEHICVESRVGTEIDGLAIPRARHGGREVALEIALHGGEDYELLFTSSKKVPSRIERVEVTCIGRITRQRGMRLLDAEGRVQKLVVQGWEHFRKNS
jgi:thiamine-monophosphate kinase